MRKPTVLDHVAGAVRAPAAANICRHGFRSHPRMMMMMKKMLRAGPRAAEMFSSRVCEQREMMECVLQVTAGGSPHLLGGATIPPPSPVCVCEDHGSTDSLRSVCVCVHKCARLSVTSCRAPCLISPPCAPCCRRSRRASSWLQSEPRGGRDEEILRPEPEVVLTPRSDRCVVLYLRRGHVL